MININGIDISNWQGDVDFTQVKNAGYSIAYIKSTEGEHTLDSTLETNYTNAKANGVKIGFYHFLHGNEDGKTQAQFMYDTIKDKNYDCKIAIDVEVTDGASVDALSKIVCDFADTITNLTGNDIVLYTYTDFLKNNLNDTINKYPLWIAEYGVSKPNVDNYIAWQYSESGSVAGIGGTSVDLDFFTVDIFLNNSADKSQTSTKTSIVTPQPTTVKFKVGEYVKIIGDTYSTGQTIPSWVKQSSYPIIQVDNDKVLLGNDLDSWVNDDEVVKVSEGFVVGQKVKIIANNYSTGQTIPSWVKEGVYTIIQVGTGKCLLGSGLDSWVNDDGLIPA